jgi:hypothetical protein
MGLSKIQSNEEAKVDKWDDMMHMMTWHGNMMRENKITIHL